MDARAAALRKHGGEAGLQKKLDSRARREDKKRAREEEAREFERALLGAGSGSDDDIVEVVAAASTAVKKPRPAPAAAAAAAPTAAAVVTDGAAVARLVAEIKRGFLEKLTWDFLRAKNAQHGCNATVTLERVEQRQFAALVGRSADPELRSLPKEAGWHRISRPLQRMFGEDWVHGRGGKYGCNSELLLGGEENPDMLLKYRPSTMTLSVSPRRALPSTRTHIARAAPIQ